MSNNNNIMADLLSSLDKLNSNLEKQQEKVTPQERVASVRAHVASSGGLLKETAGLLNEAAALRNAWDDLADPTAARQRASQRRLLEAQVRLQELQGRAAVEAAQARVDRMEAQNVLQMEALKAQQQITMASNPLGGLLGGMGMGAVEKTPEARRGLSDGQKIAFGCFAIATATAVGVAVGKTISSGRRSESVDNVIDVDFATASGG